MVAFTSTCKLLSGRLQRFAPLRLRIHTFKRGLSVALQNAVLLDTTTKEPWTEFAPLLKVAISFVNAHLNRKSNPTAADDTAGKDKKRASKAGPSQPSNPPADAAKKAAKLRTKWCRAARRTGHFRADCPGTATEAERQHCLSSFSDWKKSQQKRKGPGKKPFRP